eukprot:925290-Prorocentrum_minimum.AAC.2
MIPRRGYLAVIPWSPPGSPGGASVVGVGRKPYLAKSIYRKASRESLSAVQSDRKGGSPPLRVRPPVARSRSPPLALRAPSIITEFGYLAGASRVRGLTDNPALPSSGGDGGDGGGGGGLSATFRSRARLVIAHPHTQPPQPLLRAPHQLAQVLRPRSALEPTQKPTTPETLALKP